MSAMFVGSMTVYIIISYIIAVVDLQHYAKI